MRYLLEIKADHDRDLGGDEKAQIVMQLERVMEDRGFDQIDTTLNGQGGTVTEGTVFQMSMGKVSLGPNGVAIISTKQDPAELRLAAPVGQKILGMLSGDVVRATDGRPIQLGQIQFCLDERRPNEPTGMIKVFLHDPRRPGSDDQKMVCVFMLAVDGPWLTLMPHLPGSPGMPT